MKFTFTFIIFLVLQISFSQGCFEFDKNKHKTKIPFKLINNLIFIPIEINGVKLTFLLDTGVEETILFSLDQIDQVTLENIQKIKFRGMGILEPFEGLKSSKNKIKIKNLVDSNHDVYVVLDQDINISSTVGIPVNGIIGYHFFKNHVISVDFNKRLIIVCDDITNINPNKLIKYESIPTEIIKNKPYIIASLKTIENENYKEAKLLVDTGNSDSVWILNNLLSLPHNNIDDFLGKGFSGNVYGKRGRINSILINNYNFNNPLASFPDADNIKNIELVKDRIGSIGGELLKRFNIIFDYKNQKTYVKPNTNFYDEFNYNMSGIDIQHEGLEWVQENYTDKPIVIYKTYDSNGDDTSQKIKTKFSLKPLYTILSVRKNSPAQIAGLLAGDKVLKINNSNVHNLSLAEINQILKSDEGKKIVITVLRDNKILKFSFLLKKII